MPLLEETPRSLRIWFILAGTLHLLLGLSLLLVLDRMPAWIGALNLVVLVLGGALIYVAVKLPDLLKARSPRPKQVLATLLGFRILMTALDIHYGEATKGPLLSLAFGAMIIGYLWFQLNMLELEHSDDDSQLAQEP